MSDILLENLRKAYIQLDESTGPTFCYMLYITGSDRLKLKELQDKLDLKGEKTPKDEFHVTIRYVRAKKSDDWKFFVEYLKRQEKLPRIRAKISGFKILGKDKDCLTLTVESSELDKYFEKVNKWLTDNGYAKSDYSTYKPHITLTEQPNVEKPKWSSDYEFYVDLSMHIVSDTDHNKVFKKES